MRQTRIILPDYARRFSCIGPACEDSCCSGWSVFVDEGAYRKYSGLGAGPLRTLVDASIAVNSDRTTDAATPFATIRLLASGDCPFLTEDRLCQIQVEHGASYLCNICASFPRKRHNIDGLEETVLSPSCPEAARKILLEPRLFAAGGSCHQLTWDETGNGPLRQYFWQIRACTVSLLQNRSYPLWQRMFLLGSFSRRLEALEEGESRRVPELLDDFGRAIQTRGLCAAMENIAADLPLQLEMVLQLVAQRVGQQPLRPRVRRVLGEFLEGVGHRRGTTLEEQVTRYRKAYIQFYAPFFERRPHIVENYLLNLVLRDLFPFGEKLNDVQARVAPARAFARLAIQFCLVKGLLIGVAGFRRRKFSGGDVVRTVQTAFRHFEHNPSFLTEAYELLRERKLDDARGLTVLLRN
ncbi:MAG TPA: flagellin lysine-N-methylase [Terracidiphilus sp.]|nr:flagellin lysine-N-methylase [Terracidiphilus sp.]